MIYGKTISDQREEKQEKLKFLFENPISKFAWWPVMLNNGQKVWLQKYWSNYEVVKTTFNTYYMEMDFDKPSYKCYATEQEARNALHKTRKT